VQRGMRTHQLMSTSPLHFTVYHRADRRNRNWWIATSGTNCRLGDRQRVPHHIAVLAHIDDGKTAERSHVV